MKNRPLTLRVIPQPFRSVLFVGENKIYPPGWIFDRRQMPSSQLDVDLVPAPASALLAPVVEPTTARAATPRRAGS